MAAVFFLPLLKSGKAEIESIYEENEPYNILSEFEEFEEFEEFSDRKKAENFILVETGYKNADELSFTSDMLQSNEIYFIHGNNEIRCFVSADEKRNPLKPTTPQSLSLSIRFAEKEMFYSPEFIDNKTENIFPNITEPGFPDINSDGFIKTNQISINID